MTEKRKNLDGMMRRLDKEKRKETRAQQNKARKAEEKVREREWKKSVPRAMDDAFSYNEPDGAPKLKEKLEPKAAFPGNVDETGSQIVRSPRLVPKEVAGSKYKKQKDRLEKGGTVLQPMAVKRQTQERREKVRRWIMDGHVYNDQILSLQELAAALSVPVETLERDLSIMKEQFQAFYGKDKEVIALGYQILEMQAQDRGRALMLYNMIQKEIESQPTKVEVIAGVKLPAMSGRDRAAMFTAATAALAQANKCASSMESLFKQLDGGKRINNFINAKNLQFVGAGGKGGAMASFEGLQDMVSQMPQFRSVLPSTRKADKTEELPPMLEISEEEVQVMHIGETERKGR